MIRSGRYFSTFKFLLNAEVVFVCELTSDFQQSSFHLPNQDAAPDRLSFNQIASRGQYQVNYMHPFRISLTAARLDCLAS